jgi:hypothetical protein
MIAFFCKTSCALNTGLPMSLIGIYELALQVYSALPKLVEARQLAISLKKKSQMFCLGW